MRSGLIFLIGFGRGSARGLVGLHWLVCFRNTAPSDFGEIDNVVEMSSNLV